MSVPMIFDPARHDHAMRRAARSPEDFLLRTMMERLCERLEDIKRDFSTILDASAIHGVAAAYLPKLTRAHTILDHALSEPPWSLASDSVDLILSCGALHWINDVPGALSEMHRCLKPDGLLLAMLPGGATLHELRDAFEHADMRQRGGVSPRISPFMDIRDAGQLLQRAGFSLPVVDTERVVVQYSHPLKLLYDLRHMGQTNALHNATKYCTPRTVITEMIKTYQSHYGTKEGVPATFDLLTLTAWKPHASQQQPAKRGSASVSLTLLEK